MLYIFPTNRAIRYDISDKNNTFLNKCVTIAEFEKRVLVVEGKKSIDEDKRVIFLKNASKFDNFKKLNIPNDYLRFLSSSDFLFGFFDELAIEKVEIDDINIVDTYAQYSEHLLVLKELLDRYKRSITENGYYDKITLPENYKINEGYLKRFKKIYIHFDGYLSRFELEILDKVSKVCEVVISYETNKFIKKMIDRFNSLGFKIEKNAQYEINLTNRSEKVVKKVDNTIKKVYLSKVDERMLQVAYIKKKVHDFLKAGLKAEEIVVITPDESFVDTLKLFDINSIFNFAAGFSFKYTSLYQRIETYRLYLEDKSIENFYRVKRVFTDLFFEQSISNVKLKEIDFDNFLEQFLTDGDKESEKEIYKNEIYRFKVLKDELKDTKVSEVLHLFLSRLKGSRVDDTRGGKITVMGVLESRMVDFKGVIVVDFNDSVVPQKSSKDIFLNSTVRKRASLPTVKERENLQKNYYHKLFLNAKEVAVCAVENESSKISKFIDELDIQEIVYEDSKSDNLKNILMPKQIQRVERVEENILESFDFKSFTFSATSFKMWLECKRAFYWRYVKGLKPHEIPSQTVDAKTVGEKLHQALHELYEKDTAFFTKEELLLKLSSILLKDVKDEVLKFNLDIFLKKLEKFAENEIKRFNEGYEVYKREIKLHGDIGGFRIMGVIDRIDKRGESFSLIDYKSGKINLSEEKKLELSSNFQMEFYYTLAKQNGFKDIEEVAFYDLNKGEIVRENFLKEKLSLLEEKISLLHQNEQNFSMCEDTKVCSYCPYVMLCGKDAS